MTGMPESDEKTSGGYQAENAWLPKVPGIAYWARATLDPKEVKHRFVYRREERDFRSLCGLVVRTPMKYGPWPERPSPWCGRCEDLCGRRPLLPVASLTGRRRI